MLIILVPALVLGQTNNFEFIQYDTEYTGSDDAIYLYGDIYNISSSNQDLTVTKVTHEMPATWTAAFCVKDVCYPPFLEMITFSLDAGDTTEFSLDIFPNGELGVGSWTIFLVDSTTMEVDSTELTVELVLVSIDGGYTQPRSFDLSNIYPNPTNAWINFDMELTLAGSYTMTLYSLDGRELATRTYDLRSGKNRMQWGMGNLPSGQYILEARGNGQHISRQVSVVK